MWTQCGKLSLHRLIGLCVLFTLAGAIPTWGQLFAPHGIVSVHPGVMRSHVIGAMEQDTRLNLAVSLPVQNPELLYAAAQQVSDPASPTYRHFLTSAQFEDTFAPTPATYQTLVDYFRSRGFKINATHSDRMILDIGGSVSNIESTFHVKMLVYQHPTENRTFFGPNAQPMLDRDLPVLDVYGLDNFVLPRSNAELMPYGVTKAGGTGPGGLFVGYDFRNAYAPGVTLDGTGQTVALFQFGNYFPADITQYCNTVGLPVANISQVTLDGVSTTAQPGDNTLEQSLDIEMVHSMAPGANIVFYTGGNAADIWDQIASDDTANQVSSSWASSPPPSTLDQTLQRMGLQGQSVSNASGDSGYSTSPFGWLDDAYYTAVGGTNLSTSSTGAYSSESGWSGSGGYISPNYSLPTWQQGINFTLSGASPTQRNVPDVALTATNIWSVFNDGGTSGVAGTSCASPLWAGFMALVNEQASEYKLSPPGFVNPAVYAIGEGPNYNVDFHDIVTGNNGMSAVTGYDLVTGWGTPKGQTIIETLSGALYTLSASPTNVPVYLGASATTAISVNEPAGLTNSVKFSATGLPRGLSVSFSPQTSTTSSTMTLTAASTAAVGTSTFTVSGASGPFIVTTQVQVTVKPSFSLSSNPQNVTVYQRTSSSTNVNVTSLGGFSGIVTFAVGTLPNGVTGSFSVGSSQTGTVLTFAASASATPGVYPITITGTSSAGTETATVNLTVFGNFTISASPASLTINQRTTGTTTVTEVPTGGFSNPVTYTATGLPTGVSVIFAATSQTTASVTFAVSGTAAAGTSVVTLTGTSGVVSNSTTVSLTVIGNFTLASNPSTITLKQAKATTSTVAVNATGGFTGSVSFAVSGLPTGVTASFAPTSSSTGTTLTLVASPTAAIGPAVVTITGTSGSLTNSTTIALTISQGWTIAGFVLSPSTVTGGSASTGTITLSDPTPAGGEAVTVSVPKASSPCLSLPSVINVPAGQTTANFTMQTHTATSNQAIVITATIGTSSASATLNSNFTAGGTQAAGMQFFSVPWAYHDLLANIFEYPPTSGQISSYNTVNASYVTQGGSLANPTPVTITPGVGYWGLFPSPGESLLYLGTPASTSVPLTISLAVGYNAIGDPYTSAIGIAALTFGPSKTTFAKAAAAKTINPTLQYFSQALGATSGSYIPTTAPDSLIPGKGYWIYAYAATTMTFPLPATP